MKVSDMNPAHPFCFEDAVLAATLSAVAMVLCSMIEIVGMLYYNWNSDNLIFVFAIVGAFVYFSTMGYLQWRAARG